MRFGILAASLSLLVAGFAPVRAKAPQPPKAVAAFADDKPNCLEWTDGCIVCKKQPDNSAGCSMVGIACIPVEPICTKTKTNP